MPRKKDTEKREIQTNSNGDILTEVEEKITDGNSEKTLNYVAPLKDVKSNNQNDTDESENEFENDFQFDENEIEDIPQSPLEIFFEQLQYYSGLSNQTVFYAMVNRLPDAMSDNFINRYNGDSPAFIGKFQFSLRDIFEFTPAIQKLNNNSGGRFSITAYDASGNVIKVSYGYAARKDYRTIGIANLFVPNPVTELAEKRENGNYLSDREFFAEQQRKSDERFEKLVLAINTPKKDEIQSQIMSALIPAMISKTLNPPENSGTSSFEQTMATIMAMPVMVEKMAGKMFPEPKAENPPDFVDKANKILEVPVVANLVDAFTSVAETIITSKFQQSTNTITQNQNIKPAEQPEQFQPQQLTDEEKKDNQEMETIITEIVIELESDNVIDENNPTIVKLQREHKTKYNLIRGMCLMLPFETVFSQLVNATANMPVSPFAQFVESYDATSQQYIWNERGIYVKSRLEEVYNFVKEN